ncbi:YbaB/EbfC family nucleoid-associated protein [Micromonospora maritima]|uniref:YbaB/EbfC family nucleoid-associated protein n=1 Tax=Micromonospora maritima TaxID=986711 RepID=A0ABW7ZF53_9ACTN
MHDDTGAVTVTDSGRYVEVSMRHDGRLTALRINPHAMYDLTAPDLADACLEAIERANSLRPRSDGVSAGDRP